MYTHATEKHTRRIMPIFWLETFGDTLFPHFKAAKFGLPVKGSFLSRRIENTKQRGGGDKKFCLAPAFIFSARWQNPPPLHTTLAWALHLGVDKIARVHLLTLVWLIRSLSVSVVCLLFVVPCQTVCSECPFPVCGTNVTFVLVRVVDCFFCLSDWYSVVKLQSALAGAIQKSSILLTLPVYSSSAFLSSPFRLFLREAPTQGPAEVMVIGA